MNEIDDILKQLATPQDWNKKEADYKRIIRLCFKV